MGIYEPRDAYQRKCIVITQREQSGSARQRDTYVGKDFRLLMALNICLAHRTINNLYFG